MLVKATNKYLANLMDASELLKYAIIYLSILFVIIKAKWFFESKEDRNETPKLGSHLGRNE